MSAKRNAKRSGQAHAKSGRRAGGAEAAGGSGGFLDQIKTLAIALAIALAIRTFVIEPFTIPSGSMLPTLLIGDHLFVNKFVYGIRVPFTEIRLPGLREPQRGDVVVFTVGKRGNDIGPIDRRPDLPRDNFVKRIIGLPGDLMAMRGGLVTVNGAPLAQSDGGEIFRDGGRELHILRESLGERDHAILDDPRASPGCPQCPFRVEEGRYFMMGDNRDHSADSRIWASVCFSEIKGPAFILYWSWNYNRGWAELLNPVTWVRLLAGETR